MDPNDAIPLSCSLFFVGFILGNFAFLARVLYFKGILPRDLLTSHTAIELFDFLAVLGHQSDEISLVCVDMGKVIFAAQFAVCHIDEVFPLEQRAERIPVGYMRYIIIGIAIEEVEAQRNMSIRGNVEAKHDLLAIRTMVLVVPVFGFHRIRIVGCVRSHEGNRGAVVVNLICHEIMGFDGFKREIRHQ